MLQNTPSVIFSFEDTAKRTELSEQFLFDLSPTNQKPIQHRPPLLDPIHLHFKESTKQNRKNDTVQTEQFFQEFDNNFVVTFEEDTKPQNSQISTIAERDRLEATDADSEPMSKISLLGDQEPKKSQEEKNNLKQGFLSTGSSQLKETKYKHSPIPSFSVKKRTTFKSKENIQGTVQPEAATKKKIFNRNTLEIFRVQTKSCKIGRPSPADKGLFLTLKGWKPGEIEQPKAAEKQYQSTIFHRNSKEKKQNLQSINIDHWRRRLQLQKKNGQEKTIKRANIFSRPFHYQ